MNRKSQFILITKNIDTNVVFRFNFTKFFRYRKFNSFIIKVINKLFIFLFNSFWMYFYWVNMSYVTPKKTFLTVVFNFNQSFLGFLNLTGNFT